MADESKQTPPKPDSSEDSLDAPAITPDAPAPPAADQTAPAPASGGDAKGAPAPVPPADGAGEHIKASFNIYFIIFIVLMIGAIGIIVFAVNTSKKANKTTQTKVPSLTSQQIAALKGNTTLVGDAKTTLDVQSNSVFENQVLVRNDLNVAGALKVGGAFSLPSINATSGTFSTLQVGNTLTINGNTSVQGALTIQKSLSVAGTVSFGNLSAGSLTVSAFQANGDVSLGQHLVASGSQIKWSAGTAMGGGGTVSVRGTDVAGTITINTGSSPPPGTFASVTFTKAYSGIPRVIISPVGVNAATVTYYVNRTPTGFSLGCATAPPAGASFSFDYFVIN